MQKEDDFKSPIPQHLTPEERVVWEREAAWEEKERERRKKEGFYDNVKVNIKASGIKASGIKKRKLKLRKLKE